MSRPFLVGILLLANVFAWSIPVPHGLSVSFLDVGHGRAALLVGPGGSAVLVDGGPDSSVLREIGQRLPFFVRSLDAVVTTDGDAASVAGLTEVFSRYRVRTFIAPDALSSTRATEALEKAASTSGAVRLKPHDGMRLSLGNHAHADFLSPSVIRVTYGRTSFLLPGNATQKIQRHVSAVGDIRSDVLEVPHYGSKGSLSSGFLDAVAPRYAVISYGCENRWGYPAPETLQLFADASTRVFGTCEKGTVTFASDGKTLHITER